MYSMTLMEVVEMESNKSLVYTFVEKTLFYNKIH